MIDNERLERMYTSEPYNSNIPVLVSEVKSLQRRITELEQAQAWQPIETAPKDGTAILLYAPSEVGRGRTVWPGCYVESYAEWLQIGGGFVDPTHWRPMPDPPEVAGE